jgi:penicillin-binding protein 1A
VLVTKILDKDGNEVYVGPSSDEQVIPYKSAFLMQQMLQGGMREPGGTSQSLWGYVGDYRDTEFGGKTGTSNNHSDAWFIGVSPKLVVGAWVGGEYRSIHFRTGADGQGSRTALPICGAFIQACLGDPAFKKYHGKFDKPHDDDITRSMYTCDSYYAKAKVDTTAQDSISSTTEEITLDEDGNPIVKTVEGEAGNGETKESGTSSATSKTAPKATQKAAPKAENKEKKEKKKRTEQNVNFDDL